MAVAVAVVAAAKPQLQPYPQPQPISAAMPSPILHHCHLNREQKNHHTSIAPGRQVDMRMAAAEAAAMAMADRDNRGGRDAATDAGGSCHGDR